MMPNPNSSQNNCARNVWSVSVAATRRSPHETYHVHNKPQGRARCDKSIRKRRHPCGIDHRPLSEQSIKNVECQRAAQHDLPAQQKAARSAQGHKRFGVVCQPRTHMTSSDVLARSFALCSTQRRLVFKLTDSYRRNIFVSLTTLLISRRICNGAGLECSKRDRQRHLKAAAHAPETRDVRRSCSLKDRGCACLVLKPDLRSATCQTTRDHSVPLVLVAPTSFRGIQSGTQESVNAICEVRQWRYARGKPTLSPTSSIRMMSFDTRDMPRRMLTTEFGSRSLFSTRPAICGKPAWLA